MNNRTMTRQHTRTCIGWITITVISVLLLPIAIVSAEITNELELITAFNQVTDQTAGQFNDTVFSSQQSEETVSFGTVYATCPDLDYITRPMYDADADKNGFLNQDEYVEFADAISGGYLTNMGWDDGFTDMPLSLQETYLVLSCLCELYPNQPWGGKGCCTTNRPGEFYTGIRTDGTTPGVPPDEDELQYLTYVCGTMSTSLENVGGTIVAPPTRTPTRRPTDRPSVRPVTPPPPIVTPTPPPTVRPTTVKPTARPTFPPSKSPSKKPSLPPSPSPTNRPTPAPTTNKPTPPPVQPGAPTTSPMTSSPTIKPVVTVEPDTPTKKPSSAEPGTPTKKPSSAEPTMKPVSGIPGFPTARPSTASPTIAVVPTTKPTRSPSAKPTISAEPTGNPTDTPSGTPSISSMPTVSIAPSSPPTVTSRPTSSASPTRLRFTGVVPASVNFVASLNGLVSADAIMEGTTNQVKIMLEEELLLLSDIVIMELFHNDTISSYAESSPSIPSSNSNIMKLRRKVVRKRNLIVKEATLARVDSVEAVECPVSPSFGNCLNFNNTIMLSMVDEPDVAEKVELFEAAMLAKIADGWLVENFNLEEALKPPPAPTPPPNDIDRGEGSDNSTDDDPGLSTGALIGIIVAILACFVISAFLVSRFNNKKSDDGEEFDLERHQSVKGSDVGNDGLEPLEHVSEVEDESSQATAEKSFSSQDHLLQDQMLSTALMPPALGEVKDSEEEKDDSEIVTDSSFFSDDEKVEDADRSTSPLAAMAAASTLVASTATSSQRSKEKTDDLDRLMSAFGSKTDPLSAGESMSSEPSKSTAASLITEPSKSAEKSISTFTDSHSAASVATSDLPTESPYSNVGMGSPISAGDGDGGEWGDEGLSTGAAAAIGAAGAGVVAAGVYAATRGRSKSPEKSEGEEGDGGDESKAATGSASTPRETSSTASASTSAMDDIDNAIEAGNWGQVGALAAVLASQGHGSPERKMSARARGTSSTSKSGDDASTSQRSSNSLDQARATEIDKLVETGDWQGVVLAAARFEADQTFDGESFSASASQSSRWTGSATSATTPRSMATADQSASNISSQRGQEEIRAEVEALVRRVVPEEADNIDEMMTQFKGREEELVETLRRMQERAIASRARLAVQKSAKLEARAKASPRGAAASPSSQSVGSVGSTKSELEHAIESGNWQAVGLAAQKMSDSSVGDLSAEEKSRLRDAISQSPAFSRMAGKASEEDDTLDRLIEQGDWEGVIAAAKQASEGPDQGISTEEQDALAQANMWQEIANQSKQQTTGQDPSGAGDAAAWAISRSLNALNTPEETRVRTINDIADEQSSDASQYESSAASSYGESAGRSAEDYGRHGI